MHKFFKPSIPTTQNPNNLSSSPFSPTSYPPPPTSSSSSYPPPTGTTPFSYAPQSPPSPFHHQYHHQYHPYPQEQLPSLHIQRSVSYPTPPLQPPPQNPNPGARLMALLSAPPPPSNLDLPQQKQQQQPAPSVQPSSSGASDYLVPNAVPILPSIPSVPAVAQPGPLRMPSSKLPKGRHLNGDHVLYDVDVRLQGEVQPQLEVTPITKYVSDPGLVLGRQIAVNKTYICYGLKLGAIRVLNINTALRSLLRGHTQVVCIQYSRYVAFLVWLSLICCSSCA